MKIHNKSFLFAFAFALLGAGFSRADFLTFTQPTPTYLASTSLLPITADDFSPQTSVTDGVAIASFSISNISVDLTAYTGNSSWFTWGTPPDAETDMPRVLAVPSPANYVDVLLSGPAAIHTFGFEAEPDPFSGVHTITASFYDAGVLEGTLSRTIDGNGGSGLFAAYSDVGFDAVNISSDTDFGIAQLRYSETAPVPEPQWTMALGGCLLLFAIALRRYARN